MNIFYFLAVLAGLAIAAFSGVKEFYYLALLFFAAGVFFIAKKRKVVVTDVLILFMITIPLHTYRLGGTEHFIRLSEIAFVPLALLWIFSRFADKSGAPMKIRKEFILLVLFLGVNIAAAKNSLFPLISLKRILILSYIFFFVYIIEDIIDSREKTGYVIKAAVLISAVSAVYAVLQSVFPGLIIFTRVPIGTVFGVTFYRAGAGWHDPNYYALYLGLIAAVTLSIILSSSEKKIYLYKAAFILQILGIMATFSRTVLGSVFLVCIYLLWHYKRRAAAIITATTILSVITVITVAMPVIYKKYPFIASIAYHIPESEMLQEEPELIMGHRYAAFQANWAMFLDHPLLGVGPFMAMYNFPAYRPSGYDYPPIQLASHNQYLQLLAEKGIFGFLLFMGFILIFLRNISSAGKNTAAPQYSAFLTGAKAAVFVYLLSSLALETSYELQFWLIIGLGMAVFNLIEKEARDAS